MKCDYRAANPYRPVSYEKRECCTGNSPRNEYARDAFRGAEAIEISYLEVGKGAILIIHNRDDEPRIICTSDVEDIFTDNSGLHIVTRNSTYVMTGIYTDSVL